MRDVELRKLPMNARLAFMVWLGWNSLTGLCRSDACAAEVSTTPPRIPLSPGSNEPPGPAVLLAVPGSQPGDGMAGEAEPRLSIRRKPGAVVISWPATAAGWVLDQSPTWQTPVAWGRIPSDRLQTNDAFQSVEVSMADRNRFFRLRQVGPAVPGLTGHWQFDEGSGDTAEEWTGMGTPLFLTNGAWGRGRIGSGALRFNGSRRGDGGNRAWVSNASYRVLPPSGRPFSVSLWFSPEALPNGWQGLVGNDQDGTNGWSLALHTLGPGTNDLVFAATGVEPPLSLRARRLLLPGQWHQLTVTHDGATGCLYLDGALLACGAGGATTHDGPLFVGGGVGNYGGFAGYIDELRTYTNALTAEEIALTGHWRFDESAGRFSADDSVQGHHATVTDSAAWVAGREGSGLELSMGCAIIRNDQFTVLPPSGGPFSISCWLKPRGLSEGWNALMSCADGTNNGWRLAVHAGDSGQATLHFGSTNAGGTLDLAAPWNATNGAWTKLDLTYNGGMAAIFVDGRQVQAGSGAIQGSRAPLVVGATRGTTGFDGVIDDLKIYRRERGPAEIGPLALPMWETVLMNTTTNLRLQGFGPAGKPLTFSILPLIASTNGWAWGSAGSPIATYSAGARKGPDAFVYTVSDGEFTSAPAIVSLSVVEPHWLSPNGGTVAPLDGRSPERAWVAGPANALDAIWRTNRYYDCFFYAPGEYHTTGWRYGERPTAHPGCKHVGAGSSGSDATTLKLVDILDTWGEERIFAPRYPTDPCDGFEVHNMVLDCNASNLPKFTRGEPVWIRIPLASTSRVDSVTVRWAGGRLPSSSTWQVGRAAEFRLCTRRWVNEVLTTNCATISSTGQIDVIAVGTETDELLLELDRRAAGADFYGVAGIEIAGAAVSHATARVPGGGESRLDSPHPIALAVDGNPETWWASGPESEVELVLPLARATAIGQLNLRWKCQTIPEIGRVGPAASYTIRARDETTGLVFDVPFVQHSRTTNGWQTNTFGTVENANVIRTDQLRIRLTRRDLAVDFYGLREVSLQNGPSLVAMRIPSALNALNWGGHYGILNAFDDDPGTLWASGTQGAVGAISVIANNLKFTRLKVIGFGTKAARECFPMYLIALGSRPPRHLGNVLVEDCVFTEPAPGNTDGLSTVVLAARPPDTLTNAVVRRCTVSGVKQAFTYSHGITAVLTEDCVVEDCGQAVYFEPNPAWGDALGPFVIRSNRFLNVNSGVYVLSHPGAPFDSITCLANEFVLTGEGGLGFGACDVCLTGPSGSISEVVALNNVIRYADWAGRATRPDGGFFYSDISHAVLGNNVIALGTPHALRLRQCPAGLILAPDLTEDCNQHVFEPPGPPSYPPCLDTLRPGYRRAWFNNRDQNGALLEVRFSNRGVDGLASQQQWPE